MTYLVYEARLPNGSVYIGRTSRSLDARIAMHREQTRRESRLYGLHAAMQRGEHITWRILWAGSHFHQSMGKEIAAILSARRRGLHVLNRTRGGFYDPYDYARLRSLPRTPSLP